MEKIQSISDLEVAILLLENKQAQEEEMLREQFYLTYESIKPINIIKNLFKESVAPPNLTNNLINTTVGFGFGYLSKVIFQSVVKIPLKKLVGNALMIGVETLVVKNPEIVQSLASGFLKIMNKRKSNKNVHREPDNEPIDLETIY